MGYSSWLKRAKQRQTEVSLSQADWLRLKNSRCFYCGVEPHLLPLFYDRMNLKKTSWMTIDRKDNSRGYTLENVVSCCFNCNRIKGSFFSSDEMLFIADKIIKPRLATLDQDVWDDFIDHLPLTE